MNRKDSTLRILDAWYQLLPIEKGFQVRGAIAAALQVLEKLKINYSLDTSLHLTERKGQVSGIGGQFLAKILQGFGEHRVFLKEGGRTNRGVIGYVDSLLCAPAPAHLEALPAEERNSVIEALQLYLVDRIKDYHGQQRLEMEYDPSRTVWHAVAELLAKAKEYHKDGPLAQYLVGAKLAVRFPHIHIGNESYSTADDQLERPGDFHVGNTVFHVTVTPLPGVYDRCTRNVQQGYRVFLLVTDQRLQGAKDNVDLRDALRGKVTIESVETFVSQNIEEISEFSTEKLTRGFRLLLEKYNERVEAVETDKSLMIEIPPNLRR